MKHQRRSDSMPQMLPNYVLTVVLVISFMGCLNQVDCRPKERQKLNDVASISAESFFRETRMPRLFEGSKNVKSSIKNVRPPHLRFRSVPPTQITAPATSNQVLECEAGGNPPPQIHWLRDGKRVHKDQEKLYTDYDEADQGILGLSYTRSRLYLDCVQPEDSVVYTCVAENPYDRLSTETQLKVVSHQLNTESREDISMGNSLVSCLAKKSYGFPARIDMWTHSRIEMMGSQAQLFCRASGFPKPTISWIGPDDQVLQTGSKYEILESGDLVIKKLIWDDMGNYQCIVENQNGKDKITNFLYPTQPETP